MSSFREFVDWLWQARGAPYIWWLEGEVSRGDGPPAWAVNAPVPDISEISEAGGFCVAVYNLACRWYGITIPNPYRDEAWDGGVLSTWTYWYDNSKWYSDRRAQGFQDGDLLISPYEGPSAQGHVSMIAHYNGVPYVLEWITSGGLAWSYSPDESNTWGDYRIVVPMETWAPKVSGGGGGGSKPTPIPAKYPGHCATPKETAYYFASVAEKEFDLPGILPVMASCVEMTCGWASEGCVTNCPGFLEPMDHWSVGWFQQQYDGNPDGVTFGWGTYEQCIDAEYSLRRFCREAAGMKDFEWNRGATDPDVLGRWCQNVQRSGVPDAYRDKGYPMALVLLSGYDPDAPTPGGPGGGEEMYLAKYTFVASGQPATDFANVAVATLEALGLDAAAYNGDAAIEQAGREAREGHNVIVVGREATMRLGEEQDRAGWNEDSVVWWTEQKDDAAALGFVFKWVLWWIEEHGGENVHDLQKIYKALLKALPHGDEYTKMLKDDPIDPPPPPDLTVEERLRRLEKRVFGEEA